MYRYCTNVELILSSEINELIFIKILGMKYHFQCDKRRPKG